MYDLTDHLAELGWFHFQRGAYEKTAAYYEQVFARREKHPFYYYHLAAATWGNLKHQANALKYLSLSVDHGHLNPAEVAAAEHYQFLHGTPEWEAILERLAAETAA